MSIPIVGNTTEQYAVSVNMPQTLAIDNKGRLVTNERLGRLIRMNRENLSIENAINLNTTVTATVNYHNGLYYIGSGDSYNPSVDNSLLVYNATDMALLVKLTNPTYFGPIRECRFVRNNTQMLLISQLSYSYSLILLYQINSPINYTLLNTNIQTPTWGALSLYQVNDTFLYLVLYEVAKPIYTLSASPNGLDWSLGTLVTQVPLTALITSIAVDSCGRIWAADRNSYIYILDPITGAVLGTFQKVQNPFFILLLDDYELLVSSSTQNKIFRFAPHMSNTT